MNATVNKSLVLICAFATLVAATGCRNSYPHSFTIGTGDVERKHPEPAEGGYYTNWDPFAATVEVTPLVDVNPVQTQHVFIATVKDADGKALPERRIEWSLTGVGAIVEVDESGWMASRGHKVDNNFAISHTNRQDHVLTRGNDDPADDVVLKRGQTWIVITSPVEGTSDIIAYAPGIYDWSKHKAFAKKHWYDVAYKFPQAATNPVGTSHTFTTVVMQHSDGTPLAGYEVTYKILSGPAATLSPGGGQTAMVKTNAKGEASVKLSQTKPVEGVNQLQIDIVRPVDAGCAPCEPAAHIATGNTSKTWIGPKIAITKTAPATSVVGDNFNYNITVSNPSQVTATSVKVADPLPDGVKYVSSSPKATLRGKTLSWSLGDLGAGKSENLTVTVVATRTGNFENCATVTADMGLMAKACAQHTHVEPQLTLTKSAEAEVLTCDPINYEFRITNPGDAPATNVKFEDTLPDGLYWKGNISKIESDVGTLAPGQSKIVKFMVSAKKPGKYTNVATVKGDRGLSATAQATTVVRQPVLVISKTGPSMRYIGRPVKYTITVSNKGDAPATNVTLVDKLDPQSTFVSASSGGTAGPGTVTWKLGDIQPGGSKQVTLTETSSQTGEIKSTATATAYCATGEDDAATIIKGIPAILLECVDVRDPIEIGAEETYIITVTNQGSAVDTNILIACTLPAEQQYVSSDGPTAATVTGQQVKFAPLGSLAPKATVTYKVVVKGIKPGDVRFRVSLNSDQMTSPAGETESTNIFSD
jgi:uncharacterized repeat protein (TIGR01451 family)